MQDGDEVLKTRTELEFQELAPQPIDVVEEHREFVCLKEDGIW